MECFVKLIELYTKTDNILLQNEGSSHVYHIYAYAYVYVYMLFLLFYFNNKEYVKNKLN